jgi:hypothetical protein
MDFGYSGSPVYCTFPSFDYQKCRKNSVCIRNIVVFNRIMAYLHTSLFTTDNDMAQKKPTIDNINTIARFSHQDSSMLNVRIFSETCTHTYACRLLIGFTELFKQLVTTFSKPHRLAFLVSLHYTTW